MSISSSISFFIVIFIFGITPGPGVFALLARALTSGAYACLYLAIGMIISDILYLVAVCLGLAALASNWIYLFNIISVIGAIYLFYLGWKMWNGPLNIELMSNNHPHKSHINNFLQGFFISLSNPKVMLFYIAFLPTFMDLSNLTAEDVVLVSFLTFIGLLLGLMLIAVFAERARLLLKTEYSVKILNKTAGSIMYLAALYLALSAF